MDVWQLNFFNANMGVFYDTTEKKEQTFSKNSLK